MYQIGEFARITRVTAKALRLYDRLGILKPSSVDRYTGYRYYTVEQMAEAAKVMGLKDAGFSLNQIAVIMSGEISSEQFADLLRERISELEQEIQAKKDCLERLRARVYALLQEGDIEMSDITLKKAEPMLIASLRTGVPDFSGETLAPIWIELNRHIDSNGGKKILPCMMLYHNDGEDGLWDIEAAISLVQPIAESERVKVRELPAAERMACAIHKGPYESLHCTYRQLTEWMNDNGCEMVHPIRELYHKEGCSTVNPEGYVTEVQFPVKQDK